MLPLSKVPGSQTETTEPTPSIILQPSQFPESVLKATGPGVGNLVLGQNQTLSPIPRSLKSSGEKLGNRSYNTL